MDWCRRKKPLSFFFLFSTQSSSTYPLIHHWSLKGDQKNLSYMCFDSFKAHSLLTLYSYSCLLSGMSTAWGPITIGPKRDDANNSTINSLSERRKECGGGGGGGWRETTWFWYAPWQASSRSWRWKTSVCCVTAQVWNWRLKMVSRPSTGCLWRW